MGYIEIDLAFLAKRCEVAVTFGELWSCPNGLGADHAVKCVIVLISGEQQLLLLDEQAFGLLQLGIGELVGIEWFAIWTGITHGTKS